MNTEPIRIVGVAGPVVVSTNGFWGRPSVTVGGLPATRTGKRSFALPTRDGRTIEATIRSGLGDPYPTLDVSGERHPTGPKLPATLRVLAFLPFVMIYVGGAIGGGIGGLGFVANLAVGRTRLPSAAKALIMIGVGVAVFIVWLAIAAAIRNAIGPS